MQEGRSTYWVTVALRLDPGVEPDDLPARFQERVRDSFDGWAPAGTEVTFGRVLGPIDT